MTNRLLFSARLLDLEQRYHIITRCWRTRRWSCKAAMNVGPDPRTGKVSTMLVNMIISSVHTAKAALDYGTYRQRIPLKRQYLGIWKNV